MSLKSFIRSAGALLLLTLPACNSPHFTWTDPDAAHNEKVRAFERGGREETSAERDARASREAISAANRRSSITGPFFDP